MGEQFHVGGNGGRGSVVNGGLRRKQGHLPSVPKSNAVNDLLAVCFPFSVPTGRNSMAQGGVCGALGQRANPIHFFSGPTGRDSSANECVMACKRIRMTTRWAFFVDVKRPDPLGCADSAQGY